MRENELFMGGELVENALQIEDGIQSFITWIDSIKDAMEEDAKIVLVCYQLIYLVIFFVIFKSNNAF